MTDGLSRRKGSGPGPLSVAGDYAAFYSRSVTVAVMRVMRCDCGFGVTGDGDDELVTRAQTHAREVQSMDLPAELVLLLAKSTTERPRD